MSHRLPKDLEQELEDAFAQMLLRDQRARGGSPQ